MKRVAKEGDTDIKQEEVYSLEENFNRLEQVIGQLEQDDISLEEAFGAYSRGMAILKECNEQIDSVEKKVLKLTEEGNLEELGPIGE